ncbi:hypothetical protein [Streptomyces sp. LN325]|uniref:hypothetical protein n=1 Tax=Streptomyces sp. LN325 TaxID=3112976 RepID=UPI0037123895
MARSLPAAAVVVSNPGVDHEQGGGRGGRRGMLSVAAGSKDAGGDQADRLKRIEAHPGDRPVRSGRGVRQPSRQHGQPGQQNEPAHDQQPPGSADQPRASSASASTRFDACGRARPCSGTLSAHASPSVANS